ncbi:hypothetical protein LPW26_19705 [Rhodopseudomonas sp. HC1]|uniref:hypothetical protein n=1 Tax=Rhodopseudomonas infernalis TaxID=2897386 RepID=UPI001EE7EFBE|nr:hypothetical protein [Rhodopseudomonas infernalis]MCG6206876.1 hypothetical protein [Rhodopseudomonas infernalis]
MTSPSRCEDIFVSVCFADVPLGDAACVTELAKLSRRLSERYRYCEILLVVDADSERDLQPLISRVLNARLLMVRPATPFYRRRTAVALEAIGDVVVLASLDELPAVDIIEMIEVAAQKGSIVIGRRSRAGVMNPVLRALGHSAGFRVDMRDMLTACYPRPLIGKLLVHPDRQLALRFPPVDGGIPVSWQLCGDSRPPSRSARELGRRLAVVQKLLVSSAPRVLTVVSVLSLIVVFSAFAYVGYAIIVWLALATIQPGWFTTSLVLSLTAAFLGGAIFGLTIGLQKVIEGLSGDVMDDIVNERASVDMFDQAMKELNVETTAAVHAVPSGPPAHVEAKGAA